MICYSRIWYGFALVYNNLSHEFLLSLLWMKLLIKRETMMWEELRRHKSSILGIPKAPRWYFKKLQASKLGDAPVGIPPFFFNNYRLVSVEPKFLFTTWYVFCLERLVWYESLLVFLCFKCWILAGHTFLREQKIMLCLLLCFT